MVSRRHAGGETTCRARGSGGGSGRVVDGGRVDVVSVHVVPGRCAGQRDGRQERRRQQNGQKPVQLAGQFRGGGRGPVPGRGQRRLPAGRHDRVLQGARPVRPGRFLRARLVPAQRERARGPAARRRRRRRRQRPVIPGVRVLDGTAAGRRRMGPAGEVRHAQSGTVPAVRRRRGARARRADRGRTVLAPVHRRDIHRAGHARGQEGTAYQ